MLKLIYICIYKHIHHLRHVIIFFVKTIEAINIINSLATVCTFSTEPLNTSHKPRRLPLFNVNIGYPF